MDVEQCSTGEKTIEVILDSENLPVYANLGFVDTITEEMRTIVERHCQLIGRSDLPIVVRDALHETPPCNMKSPRFRGPSLLAEE